MRPALLPILLLTACGSAPTLTVRGHAANAAHAPLSRHLIHVGLPAFGPGFDVWTDAEGAFTVEVSRRPSMDDVFVDRLTTSSLQGDTSVAVSFRTSSSDPLTLDLVLPPNDLTVETTGETQTVQAQAPVTSASLCLEPDRPCVPVDGGSLTLPARAREDFPAIFTVRTETAGDGGVVFWSQTMRSQVLPPATPPALSRGARCRLNGVAEPPPCTLTDGVFGTQGFAEGVTELELELSGPQVLSAAVLRALDVRPTFGSSSALVVEGSLDGATWDTLWCDDSPTLPMSEWEPLGLQPAGAVRLVRIRGAPPGQVFFQRAGELSFF